MEQLSSADFDSKTGSGTVVVDFYADWCGPCRRLSPMIEELSGQIKDAQFYKLDVDSAGAIAQRFGVQSIPTVIVFKDGDVVERLVGLPPRDELTKSIQAHV